MEHIAPILDRVMSELEKAKDLSVCAKCKKEVQMQLRLKVFSNGVKHMERICPSCGAFNQYQAQEIDEETNQDWKMPFGKHKGERLLNLPPDYIGWGYENLTGNLQKRFLIEAKRRGMDLSKWVP